MNMDMMDAWDAPEPLTSALPWKSTSTSCLPSMSESLVADTHFSFCIVDKNVWNSTSTTLSTKLASGRYWDIRGQDEWQGGEKWSEKEVQKILGVEVLGLVQGNDGSVAFDTCKKCEFPLQTMLVGFR
jgi:hypothetical protein